MTVLMWIPGAVHGLCESDGVFASSNAGALRSLILRACARCLSGWPDVTVI
jgi:hypothetical protein